MLKLTALLIATVFALPAADGGSAPSAGKHGKHPRLHEKLLEKFDADHDGKLSDSEREAAKAACKERRDEAKGKFDADQDGKLSESERDAAREAMSARLKEKHPKLFAKIDTDGDGTISRDEAKAAREELRARRAAHHKGGDNEGAGE